MNTDELVKDFLAKQGEIKKLPAKTAFGIKGGQWAKDNRKKTQKN